MPKRMQANKNRPRAKAATETPVRLKAGTEMEMDPLLALLKGLVTSPRKGPLRIEIHRLPEQGDGSDGGPEMGSGHRHTEETSGQAYARGGNGGGDYARTLMGDLAGDGRVAEATDRVMGMENRKLGEIDRLMVDLDRGVQGLFDDARLLAEKLDGALMPSLLNKVTDSDKDQATSAGGPASRLGRQLLDTISQVSRLRVEINDLTARVAL